MSIYNDLMEGTDKAAFLRWLHAEMSIFGDQIAPAERDSEINRICQRWIKYKIRQSAEDAKAGEASKRVAEHIPLSANCPCDGCQADRDIFRPAKRSTLRGFTF